MNVPTPPLRHKNEYPHQMVIPKAFSLILLVGSFASVFVAALTVALGGVGFDAPFEIEIAAILSAASSGFISLEDFQARVSPQDYGKGNLLGQLASLLGRLLGTGPLTESLTDLNNYHLLGATSIFLAVLAISVLSGVLGYLTKRFWVGLAAFALTFSLPIWIGLSAVDYRDITVASGLTLVTAAILLAVNSRIGVLPLVFAPTLGLIGATLAISGRAGSVAFIGVLLIVMVALSAFQKSFAWTRLVPPALVILGVSFGVVVVGLMHPVGRNDFIRWVEEVVRYSGDHPNVMLVRVLGQNVMSDALPWWYLPASLLAVLPIGVLALAVVAFLGISFRGWVRTDSWAAIRLLGPLTAQGILLPVLVFLSGANIFDGLRHIVFIFPALMSMLVVMLGYSRVRPLIISWLLVTVVALNLFASVRWFPYSYAFINPIAGLVKDVRVWELDYWGLTTREAIDVLESEGISVIGVLPSAAPATPFGGSEWAMLQGKLVDRDVSTYGAVTFLRWDSFLPEQCEIVFEIRRDGLLLSQAGVCPNE